MSGCPAEIEKFVTLYINSGLIGKREADAVLAAFQEACRDWGKPLELGELCNFLISTDRLTAWQCDKLRVGKWKGFYLDNYLLMEQVGKGTDYSSYKARDTRNGKVVCLAVTPVNQTNGRIEYRVEPFVE